MLAKVRHESVLDSRPSAKSETPLMTIHSTSKSCAAVYRPKRRTKDVSVYNHRKTEKKAGSRDSQFSQHKRKDLGLSTVRITPFDTDFTIWKYRCRISLIIVICVRRRES